MERNRLGQFATPPALAEQIASIALTYHPPGPIRFLEPSVGAGAFYEALLSACPAGRIASARGVEVDPRFASAARRLWGDRGLSVTEGDFTALEVPAAPADRATLVLANPPYSRHHHLDAAQKAAIQARLRAAGLGSGLSGLSGLYLYFMLLAHAWAAPGGVSAWLLPSEWMDVNYGESLKAYLRERVRLLRIHRFEAEDMQFGEAMVTSSVVFFRHAPPDPSATVLLTAGSLPAPTLRREVFCHALQPSQKWGTLFRAAPAPVAVAPALHLREFLEVRRGIATGANGFFIRPRSVFRALGVGDRFLRPILPSPRDLPGTEIGAAPDGWPDLPDPPALLDCRLPETSLPAHPALHTLLTSPEAQAIRAGYLCSHRAPWYLQEQRPHAPILATYMGRSRDGAAPIRFIKNRSRATAANSWLLLSPTPRLTALLQAQPDALDRLLGFLQARTADQLTDQGRTYGGGLSKLEPKELASLDISDLAAILSTGDQTC